MKAIQVKYLPVTNTKPARLQAWANGVMPVIFSLEECEPQRDGISREQTIAEFLANKYNWLGNKYKLVGGQLPNYDFAFVITLNEGVK